jgi:hypothetical protein
MEISPSASISPVISVTTGTPFKFHDVAFDAELREMHLINYGNGYRFIPERYLPVRNGEIKPKGGLWSSPVGAEYGWRWWCEEADYHVDLLDQFFTFWIKGRVLKIDSVDEMMRMPWKPVDDRYPSLTRPDFERMRYSGIDAIWLTSNGERETRLSVPHNLYGWDCETVYVMNPDCILDYSGRAQERKE